jgi:alkaline phosphatase D
MLLLLLACSDDGVKRSRPGTDAPDDSAGDSRDAEPPLPDLDADGVDAGTDCDDADPGVYPGATEVCDGLDQDCDGAADEGIPSDGAGCLDPGMPVFPSVVDTVHVTLRTADGANDGTDDGGIAVCLSSSLCFSPYKENWDDLEPGVVDVVMVEGLGVERASLDRLTLEASSGEDLWRPAGVEVALDGELVYCQSTDVDLGNASGETMRWSDPGGLSVGCATVDDAPLTLGPMVGAVGPDRARIWYRTNATRQVRLYVGAEETALATAAPVHYGYPAASRDFTDTVEVVGLSPSTRYVYALEVEGTRYGPWSFTTAPATGTTGALRLAFGSCAYVSEQPVFGSIRAWDPDIFLFLGDNHYGNTDELAALRQHYRWTHARDQRAELLAETSILATWDDHDYVGNNTDGSASGKDDALRAFEEYWANASYGTDTIPGVFGRQSWGDVEIFLLDDRYHRDLDGTMLGAAQTEWLIAALAESDATFKLVASGSQFTPYGTDDSWAAFSEAWTDLREAIVASRIEGIVLLSGDIHRFEVRALTPASGGYTLPEITSSPLAQDGMSGCGSDANEPDRVLCIDDDNGFVGLEIDTAAADPTLLATFYDADGNVAGTWSTTRSALGLP